MLSSEGDSESEEENKDVSFTLILDNVRSHSSFKKVTISTCHAAKGLEWPVVIVPSGERVWILFLTGTHLLLVEDGTFPFHRAEDVDEER